MARFEKCVLCGLALFVLIACAALFMLAIDAPSQTQQHQEQKTTTSSEQCAASLGAFGIGIGTKTEQPVTSDSDKREKADLCQQIRMADAAEDAAKVGWLQFRLGIAGLTGLALTVIFTGLAWRAAKDAAKHTARTADIAKQALIESQRAWIRREEIVFNTSLEFTENGGAFTSITFKFKNVGNAPASHINKFAQLFPVDNGQIPRRRALEFFEWAKQRPANSGFPLFPGETYPRLRDTEVSTLANISPEDVASATDEGGRVVLYLAACVNYSFSSDPGKNHQTGCLFEIGSKSGWITRDKGKIYDAQIIWEGAGFLGMDFAD